MKMFVANALRTVPKEEFYKSPIKLYKYLLRECEKLPGDAKSFYRHSIQQSFKQHVNEPDPERVRAIISKTLQDAEWIKNKYAAKT